MQQIPSSSRQQLVAAVYTAVTAGKQASTPSYEALYKLFNPFTAQALRFGSIGRGKNMFVALYISMYIRYIYIGPGVFFSPLFPAYPGPTIKEGEGVEVG